MLPLDDQPIAAIATAPGRGAVGIVRLSGRDLRVVIEAVCGRPLLPRHASFGPFRDAHGMPIDHGLAIHFPSPHSYTGEEVLELQAHGGPVVLQLLLARCLQAGAPIGLRLAQAGEFTRRAFLNDKLDLAQAEAVADLIDASTEAAARSAARSLAGEFSAQVQALAAQLLELRMLVEATLDFPEEEIDFLERAQARQRVKQALAALHHLQQRAQQGALLREGITVVIAGQPNVGKSSLLNALAGAFSQRVDALLRRVVTLRTLVEATLDFPEEEVDFLFGKVQRGFDQHAQAHDVVVERIHVLREGAAERGHGAACGGFG